MGHLHSQEMTFRDQKQQSKMLLQVTGISPLKVETLRFPSQTSATRLWVLTEARMQVMTQVSSMLKDTEMDGRGCSQIEHLACQHPRQWCQQRGCRWTPGGCCGMWSVFPLLHCVIPRASSYIMARYVKDNYIVSHISYCVRFCYISFCIVIH